MAPIGRIPINNLAELEVALRNITSNLQTKPDKQELPPLDFFEDDNIFTPSGRYLKNEHKDGERIADFRDQILLLLSNLFPADEMEPPSIRLLGQGSYNMVVGVNVKHRGSPDNDSKLSSKALKLFGTPPKPQTFALRIPVACYNGFDVPFASEYIDDVQQDVANLQVIGEHLQLPIPKILEYNLTNQNPLGRPFTLQSYIPGKNLGVLWYHLNLKQKVSAIEAVTKIVEKIASITSPAAGNIALGSITSPSTAIKLTEFPIPTKGQAPKRTLPDLCEAMEQTPAAFMMRCCSRWIRYEETFRSCRSSTTALWHKILDIIQILEKKGWLGDRFHLVHGDLFPRNILVEVVNDTSVKITGIVDWDMACFKPMFCAFRGPTWAWNDMNELSEDGANTGAYGKEGKTIKEAFLNAASPVYATMALAEEAIILRKIHKIVIHGLLRNEPRKLASELIAQWDELHPALSKDFVAL